MAFDLKVASAGGPTEAALPEVAAVVLAAGLSRRRMAPQNKLLVTDATGKTMVARVVDAALASRACGVWVVVGHQAGLVKSALGGRDVRLVGAPDYASGLAASLASGIGALPSQVAAALICLADMPEVSGRQIDQIIGAYQPGAGRLIVVPVHGGRRGNPVLWDRRFFPEMLALSGDRGARALLLRHAAYVCEVDLGSVAVLRDFDTPEALADLA